MSGSNIEYQNLFHGILAMDVYHRGVNSGLKNLSESKNNPNFTELVGTARVVRNSQDTTLEEDDRLEAKIGFVLHSRLKCTSC